MTDCYETMATIKHYLKQYFTNCCVAYNIMDDPGELGLFVTEKQIVTFILSCKVCGNGTRQTHLFTIVPIPG